MNQLVPVDPPRKPRRFPPIEYYLVIPGGVRRCNLMEWSEQYGKGEHFIARTTLGNGEVRVSTICLGFDVSLGFGKVQLFESAIIWKANVQGDLMTDRGIEVMDRYSTYEEALLGHEAIVAEVLKKVGGFLSHDKREPQCHACTDVPLNYEGCFCREWNK